MFVRRFTSPVGFPWTLSARFYCESKSSVVPILKEIRATTGAGIMECKRMLEKHNMDKDKAIEELTAIARASKGRGRNTAAGWIGLAVENSRGVVLELLSETDFVSKNEQFRSLSNTLASTALKNAPNQEGSFELSVEDVNKQTVEGATITVSEKISELIFSMGETMKIGKCEGLQLSQGVVNGYVHGGRLGVLVGLHGSDQVNADLARDLAIHIAACSPEYISKETVPEGQTVSDKNLLVEQDYIHDESVTVKEVLARHGNPIVTMHVMRR